jgi:D-arabinose 1-dehydrogenase-like Zn-dependent alcohol dehydrogenase
VSGATSGHLATVDLRRLFALQLEIVGTSMGSCAELGELLDLLAAGTVTPIVDSVLGFSEVRQAFELLAAGNVFGKLVLDHSR